MRIRMRVLGTLMLSALTWAGVAVAGQGEKAAMFSHPSGAAMAYTCAACHGTNGESRGPAIPTIAGLSPEYFTKSMLEFRNGKRPATVMDRIAKGYTRAQIQAMATFFAKQPFVTHPQSFDPARAELGRRIHDIYCFKCHTSNGSTRIDHAGILAGQWAPYLRTALLDASAGDRPMPRAMRVRMEHLYDAFGQQAIDALVDFYVSQTKPK